MSDFRHIVRPFSPILFSQIMKARRALEPVSHLPWLDACSPRKRTAIDVSRFPILPPAFKGSPQFVIDVGACRGQWIGSLLEIISVPEVWIFEPNQEAMGACRQRIGDRAGVKYFDMALGDKRGQMTLHVTGSSELASVLRPRDEFLGTYYGNKAARVVEDRTVEVRTLDSLVPESTFVDLLKIDVQGFERSVLSGARRVLSKTRTVLIEALLQSHYVGDDNFPALWTLLAEQGFSFWNMSPPYIANDGKALWIDTVFVKPNRDER
jgi:FkbM family methyltransferase